MMKVIYAKDSGMKIRKKSEYKRGFTLVELSLSMAFVSILSITVALIISNTIATYHRGVILNQINTVGMEIVDDMRFSIQNSQVESSCRGEDGCVTFKNSKPEPVSKRNGNGEATGETLRQDVSKYGVFCTGSYSYLWNSGYLWDNNAYGFRDSNKLEITFLDPDHEDKPTTRNDFKLLKILDRKRNVCKKFNEDDNKVDISEFEKISEPPVDLMESSGGLVLYSLNVSSTFSKTIDNAFYSVSFILGTIQGGIDVTAEGDYCKVPGDVNNADIEAFDYCAINKFNFAAQANGGLSK